MLAIKTVVIGANQEFEAPLREYFSTIKNVNLVAFEPELSDGLVAISSHLPELLLIDCVSLQKDASQLIRQLRELSAHSKICLLTMHDEPLYRDFALEQGADGVISLLSFENGFKEVMASLFSQTE